MSPTDNLDRGDLVDRPTAGPGNKDKFFYAEDTEDMYLSDGTQWLGPIGADPAETPKVVSSMRDDVYPLTNATAIGSDGQSALPLGSPLDLTIVNTNPNQSMRMVAHAHLPPLNLSARDAGAAPMPGEIHHSRVAVLEHVETGNDATDGSAGVSFSEVAPLGSAFGSGIIIPGLHLQLHATVAPNTLATFRLSEFAITINFDDTVIDHVRVGVQENNSPARTRMSIVGVAI